MGTVRGAALDCLGYNLRSIDLAESQTETETETEIGTEAEAALCGSGRIGFIVMLLIAFALPLMKYERKLMSF